MKVSSKKLTIQFFVFFCTKLQFLSNSHNKYTNFQLIDLTDLVYAKIAKKGRKNIKKVLESVRKEIKIFFITVHYFFQVHISFPVFPFSKNSCQFRPLSLLV